MTMFTIAKAQANFVAVHGKSHGQTMETDTHKDWTFIITAPDEIICVLNIGTGMCRKTPTVSIGNGTIMIASGWSMDRGTSPIWKKSGFTTTH